MTLEELLSFTKSLATSFNNILFGPLTIPNELNVDNIDKVRKEQTRQLCSQHNPDITYAEGDIVAYNGGIYISQKDDNTSSLDSSDWKLAPATNITKGSAVPVATAVFFRYKDTNELKANINISSYEYTKNDDNMQVKFYLDSGAGITDTNYTVLVSQGKYDSDMYSSYIIEKTSTYFTIESRKYDYYDYKYLHITVFN